MPHIILSGHHPDADPVLVEEADTTVTFLPGADFTFDWPKLTGFAVSGVWSATNMTIEVEGAVHATGDGVLSSYVQYGARYRVGTAGVVDALSAYGTAIRASFDAVIENAGTIRAAGAYAVDLTDPIAAVILNDGTISGVPGAVGVTTQSHGTSVTLVNRGTMRAVAGDSGVEGPTDGEAVYLTADLVTVNNSGEIAGLRQDASALALDSYYARLDITALLVNSGTIRSTDLWGIDLGRMFGTATVTNSGTVSGGTGALLGSAGADTVTNRGVMDGDVRLGGGDDVFDGSAYGRQTGVIAGGTGNDLIIGGDTDDSIRGGQGDDTLDGARGTDAFDGGPGADTLVYSYPETLGAMRVDLVAGTVTFADGAAPPETVVRVENVTTGQGDDVFVGDAAANRFIGYFGDDTFAGGAGNDTLDGREGDDVFDGGGGNDSIIGGAGNDTVLYTGNTTPVRVDLYLQRVSFPGQTWLPERLSSIEAAVTGSGDDILIGSGASNILRGMAGNDTLEGGRGADHLTGGAGRDVFVFADWFESSTEWTDRLHPGDGGRAFDGPGAAAGDRISLAAIDARPDLPGDQAFVFGGEGDGHLRLEEVGTVTHVRASATDAGLELDIAILDGAVRASDYTAADFIL